MVRCSPFTGKSTSSEVLVAIFPKKSLRAKTPTMMIARARLLIQIISRVDQPFSREGEFLSDWVESDDFSMLE